MNRGEKILNEISKGEMKLLREKKQQCSERRLDGERRRIRKKEDRKKKKRGEGKKIMKEKLGEKRTIRIMQKLCYSSLIKNENNF
jgi:hypothetical protein